MCRAVLSHHCVVMIFPGMEKAREPPPPPHSTPPPVPAQPNPPDDEMMMTKFDRFCPFKTKVNLDPHHVHLRVQHIPLIDVMGLMTLLERSLFLQILGHFLAPLKSFWWLWRRNIPFTIRGTKEFCMATTVSHYCHLTQSPHCRMPRTFLISF